VVYDKITAVCKIGKTKLDLFRIHQKVLMAEGGKPPGQGLGTPAGGIRRMDDAHSHENSNSLKWSAFNLD
jgi:hypothetical protein